MKFKEAHVGTRWKLSNGIVIEVLEKEDTKVKLGFVGEFGKIDAPIEVDGNLEYNVIKMKDAYGDHIGSPAAITYTELRRGGTRQEICDRIEKIHTKLPRQFLNRLIGACLTELRSKDKLDATLLPSGDVFYRSK